MELSEKRHRAIDCKGHLLILGGPGSGKTTLALLKSKMRVGSLQPGQELLFMSFSRAAVQQIQNRGTGVLTVTERQLIRVKTYHAFCLEILHSFGRMLGGRSLRFLPPGDERMRKSEFAGDWTAERNRLAREDGLYCFDLFASGVADLLERSPALRALINDKYPFVVLDEFQDTADEQWRLVQALGRGTELCVLADPEQRIFEYRADVDPQRIETFKQAFSPVECDLGAENHRSPTAGGILAFADAVLGNRTLPTTNDVRSVSYPPRARALDAAAHAAVIWMFSDLRKAGVDKPTVAVLARSNALIQRVSFALGDARVYSSAHLPPVQHSVVWDAELSAAAAVVIGTILEWSGASKQVAVAGTLQAVCRYLRMKNSESPAASTTDRLRKIGEAEGAVVAGLKVKTKAARELLASFDGFDQLTGGAVDDWKRARTALERIKGFDDLVRDVRLVRLFRATDTLAAGLGTLWSDQGNYRGAATVVRRILDRERLLSTERAPDDCTLMNMHKAKGKEFDGVVIVEGQYGGEFYDNRESIPFERSRRLLRMAITRARRFVTLVRPFDAPSLVGT